MKHIIFIITRFVFDWRPIYIILIINWNENNHILYVLSRLVFKINIVYIDVKIEVIHVLASNEVFIQTNKLNRLIFIQLSNGA